MTPRYIGSEIYRHSSYGPKHPLAIPRVSVCTDLVRAMGWLDDTAYLEAPLATDDLLHRFHTQPYIAALKQAEADQEVTDDIRARHQLGAAGNPVFRDMFRRPATSAGGVALACRSVIPGGIVHCPGGGTHHGRPCVSQMWMRNTITSLDMIFIGQDGRIRTIVERTIPQSLAIIDSKVPVRATLEVAGGTCQRLEINVGDRVSHIMFSMNPG